MTIQKTRPTPDLSIAEAIDSLMRDGMPLRFTAYDGSAVGPPDSSIRLELTSPRGLAYLLTAPGDLGMARAYVGGDLLIHGAHPGDPYEALVSLQSNLRFRTPTAGEGLAVLRSLGFGSLKPPPPPPQEALPRWRRAVEGLRHSRGRDAEVISHHYDVSNRFYELVLGPSMTYTCAVFPHADATLEQAQAEKYDLVCRKLGLQPGQRLLDVGCGWGGMVRHAAREYGVHALGVTLSRQQAEWGKDAIDREGLGDLAEVRHLDYRDVLESDFDAVSSIGLTEHIGVRNYPAYFAPPPRPAASGRAAAQPLHHPVPQPAPGHRRVPRPLRLPRRRADRVGPDHHARPRTPGSRSCTRRTCAATTR